MNTLRIKNRPFMALQLLIVGTALLLGSCGSKPESETVRTDAETLITQPVRAGNKNTMAVKISLAQAIESSKANLIARLGKVDIEVVQAERVTWSDGSAGCPQPGHMYTQALTPGYLIVLKNQGTDYRYHGTTRNSPQQCPAGRAKQPVGNSPDI